VAEQVDQIAIEPASKGLPAADLDQALLEPAARPLPPSDLLQQVAEPAVRPDPPVRVDALDAETTAHPDPPVAVLATLIEVVWREPPPRGIFAFRHDWSQPWVERWAWKTQILRSRDGTESRIRLRRHPRRAVEMLVTAWDAGAIGLDAWLTEHQGREALIPVWPVACRVTAEAAAGGTTVQLDAVTDPLMRATQTEMLDNWGQGPGLILAPDGDVQQVSVTAFDTSLQQASLALPLARPVAAGSTFVPLVRGTVADATTARRHCAAATSQPVEILLDERDRVPGTDRADRQPYRSALDPASGRSPLPHPQPPLAGGGPGGHRPAAGVVRVSGRTPQPRLAAGRVHGPCVGAGGKHR